MKYCSKCGKELTMQDEDYTVIACQTKVYEADSTVEQKLFLDKQLGKYAGETEWNFCWECWLDALMGKLNG